MYPKFPPITRLNRPYTITEKIDGTNGLITILDYDQSDSYDAPALAWNSGNGDRIFAGSRNRWLTDTKDNYGFAAWVKQNAATLRNALGYGHHYGEWWGSGINRGYGLQKGEKRFSVFNTTKFADLASNEEAEAIGLGVVPVLFNGEGTPDQELVFGVKVSMSALRQHGSFAVPNFKNPEGIVAFLHASNSLFKVTLLNDQIPKSANV
jgi:hypothetical protein